MKDIYTIQKAYPGKLADQFNEVEISSPNLIYTELMHTHTGCQVNNLENADLIHKKCREISELIKEIDKLNQ